MCAAARALRDAPPNPWIVRFTLHDVLLAHWPVPASLLREHVPVPLDTYGGEAWITVMPYDVSELRLRLLPRIPGLDAFATLAVRTPVMVDRKPGYWFCTIEATNPLAVLAGRWLQRLPYQHALATLGGRGGSKFFYCRRRHRGMPPAQFSAHYAPAGDIFTAERGSLTEFLVERYYLYTRDGRGQLYRGEINHRPWPLQEATARIAMSGLLPDGLRSPAGPPLVHYCGRLDVRGWPFERMYDDATGTRSSELEWRA